MLLATTCCSVFHSLVDLGPVEVASVSHNCCVCRSSCSYGRIQNATSVVLESTKDGFSMFVKVACSDNNTQQLFVGSCASSLVNSSTHGICDRQVWQVSPTNDAVFEKACE